MRSVVVPLGVDNVSGAADKINHLDAVLKELAFEYVWKGNAWDGYSRAVVRKNISNHLNGLAHQVYRLEKKLNPNFETDEKKKKIAIMKMSCNFFNVLNSFKWTASAEDIKRQIDFTVFTMIEDIKDMTAVGFKGNADLSSMPSVEEVVLRSVADTGRTM